MALSYLPYILKKGLSQSFFIQPAPLTEKNVPDQTDRVFIITGGYGTGVGFQLADILYGANGVVWIAGRSESKAAKAIEQLTARHPNSAGKLHFLNLDLSDLTTIKPAVSDFLRRNESGKLHWLNNNAGVMVPPAKSTGAQGYDLQYVTNIYGPFLLTKLLLPTLRETARAERVSTQAGNQKRQGHPVRVSWAGSTASYLSKPRLGIAWTNDGKELVSAFDDPQGGYAVSKAANWYLANEFGRRHGDEDGVMHNSYNPGNLRTELKRHLPSFISSLIDAFIHPPIQGAYTELYCGLSEDLTLPNDQGAWIVPWGQKSDMRPDMLEEVAKNGAKGSVGQRLWDWCDGIVREYE